MSVYCTVAVAPSLYRSLIIKFGLEPDLFLEEHSQEIFGRLMTALQAAGRDDNEELRTSVLNTIAALTEFPSFNAILEPLLKHCLKYVARRRRGGACI